MNRDQSRNRIFRTVLVSALATTMLSGCKTNAPRADVAASKAQSQLEKGNVSKAIANAEKAVAANPRNPQYRAILAGAYMEAGRFQSAATTYDDAMKLGDNSPRTALSLALAKIASGDMTGAQAILYDWKDELDVSDLGLATSLAGAPQRGVQILSDALRGGANTPKIRQNLAYSYALLGDWRSARLMASEDLPADKVGDRMAEWASTASPGQDQARVAALIGAPIRQDSGQPAQLALSNSPSAEQLATEAAGLVPVAQNDYANPGPNRSPVGDNGELPSVAGYDDAPYEVTRVAVSPQPRQVAATELDPAAELPESAEPEVDVAAYQAPVVRPKSFEQAFAAPAPRGGTLGDVAAQTIEFVSRPVVQKLPVRYGATETEPAPQRYASVSQPVARRSVEASSTNESTSPSATTANDGSREVFRSTRFAGVGPTSAELVQLGSFASEQGARRAWGIFAARWASLSDYEMVITKARVNGRLYYRVSAGGFKGRGANTLCSQVRNQGYDCFAWAAARPLPGALTTPQLARR